MASTVVDSSVLKWRPEDFLVVESMALRLRHDGRGGYQYLRLRKRGHSTFAAVATVAAFANLPPREVSYAGLKDEDAVTDQYLSVPACEAGYPVGVGAVEVVDWVSGLARGHRQVLVGDCVLVLQVGVGHLPRWQVGESGHGRHGGEGAVAAFAQPQVLITATAVVAKTQRHGLDDEEVLGPPLEHRTVNDSASHVFSGFTAALSRPGDVAARMSDRLPTLRPVRPRPMRARWLLCSRSEIDRRDAGF